MSVTVAIAKDFSRVTVNNKHLNNVLSLFWCLGNAIKTSNLSLTVMSIAMLSVCLEQPPEEIIGFVRLARPYYELFPDVFLTTTVEYQDTPTGDLILCIDSDYNVTGNSVLVCGLVNNPRRLSTADGICDLLKLGIPLFLALAIHVLAKTWGSTNLMDYP